jgi:hypothetical protein
MYIRKRKNIKRNNGGTILSTCCFTYQDSFQELVSLDGLGVTEATETKIAARLQQQQEKKGIILDHLGNHEFSLTIHGYRLCNSGPMEEIRYEELKPPLAAIQCCYAHMSPHMLD